MILLIPQMANTQHNSTVYHTLLFNSRNHLLLTRTAETENQWDPPFSGNVSEDENLEKISEAELKEFTGRAISTTIIFDANTSNETDHPSSFRHPILFALDEVLDQTPLATFYSLEELYALMGKNPETFTPFLREIIPHLHTYAIRIPYLNQKETNYIYRFRTEKNRNKEIYHMDSKAEALYQSSLCQAIKLVKRQKERSPDLPA
ncbi:MAG: hypothetical protein JKY51_04455, partial [Opitutaceae bacterium]|nr:hypothetical protein [Opitutaceae bacterium]